jgi:hypothetical protein
MGVHPVGYHMEHIANRGKRCPVARTMKEEVRPGGAKEDDALKEELLVQILFKFSSISFILARYNGI